MTLTAPTISTPSLSGAIVQTPNAEENASLLRLAFSSALQRHVSDGDPDSVLLDLIAFAYTLSQHATIEGARQTMLSYATGANLDLIAHPFGVERLPAAFSLTSLSLSVTAPLPLALSFPIGLRCLSADNQFFELTEAGSLPAGDVDATITLSAKAVVDGTIGNVEANTIEYLVSLIPFVKVTNAAAASGGADREDDESLRERIPAAIEAAAPGSAEGYAAIVKARSPAIIDVAVFGPIERLAENRDALDGHAEIFVLTESGLPTNALLESLQTEIRASEKGRIIGDYVWLLAPTPIVLDATITIYLKPAFQTDAVRSAVTDAILAELAIRTGLLGASTHVSQIEAVAIAVDGVLAVDAVLLANGNPDDSIVLTRSQWLQVGAITITIGGDSLP
jgi:phage-related baseplate assembly protein